MTVRQLLKCVATVFVLATLVFYSYVFWADIYGHPSVVTPANAAGSLLSRDSILRLERQPILGSAEAPVAIVEFSDYECPYCAVHATTTFNEIKRDLISPGKVRYVFVNNPLPLHRQATYLATAALCVGSDKYWLMHDKLFAERPREASQIVGIIQRLGVDVRGFTECLNNDIQIRNQIAGDLGIASSLGLTATPAFAVGAVEADNTVHVRTIIFGAQPITTFLTAVQSVLTTAPGGR